MKIKVMNYNILHGFHQSTEPFSLETKRLEAAQQIIAAENPDIIALTEAAYGSPNTFGAYMNYAKLFGYSHSFFAPYKHEWGNCLLSRYPIQGKVVKLTNRTALRAKIQVGRKELQIDIFHPHPALTEDEKIAAIDPLMKDISELYLLTGDFNALSDEDSYDKDRLIRGFQRFDKTPEITVTKLLERKLIPYIRSKCLRDASKPEERVFTVPTPIYGSHVESAMRVDYFFVTPKIKTLETKVIKGKLADIASDHYPIVCTLEV